MVVGIGFDVVFVMLKICIGWDCEYKNVIMVVCLVEVVGILMLIVYGCMCVDLYWGDVEYDMIVVVKVVVWILVVVNGDIMLFVKVKVVFDVIGVDVLMIGCVV